LETEFPGTLEMEVGILEHGVGNFGSVQNALTTLGFDAAWIHRASEVIQPEILVIPGVSSFPALMNALEENDFVAPLKERFEQGRAILGICSGMQILASRGYEFQETKGLGFIPGEVKKLCVVETELPQIGFNTVVFHGEMADSENDCDFYFLNSYGFFAEDQSMVVGSYRYGEIAAAVVQNKKVLGIQFHPEKSHLAGVYFLGRAIERLRNNG
jgi:glutamine amidotransferase